LIEASFLTWWEWAPVEGTYTAGPRLLALVGYPMPSPRAVPTSHAAWVDRIHPDDRASYLRTAGAAARYRGEYQHAHRLQHRDGRWIHVLDRGWAAPAWTEEEPRMCGVCIDVTTEREAQRTAIEANRAKTDFLANMSHELRTPLNAVLGLSEALLEGTFGGLVADQVHALRTIHDSGRHLLALINDVLDIARVEADKLRIDRQPIALRSVVDDAIALIQVQTRNRDQRVTTELADGVPAVAVDRRRLKQVLLNLLGNATKFAGPGARIAVQVARREPGWVELAVSDDGPGIDPADHARIFEPFVTLDGGRTREQDGAGLGLALSRRIVELHGGTLRVVSARGAGAMFVIRLPIDAPADAGAATGAAAAALVRSRDAATARGVVVVIDDAEAEVMAVQTYLDALGYRTRVARDAATADVRAPDVIAVVMGAPATPWALARLRAGLGAAGDPDRALIVMAEQPTAADEARYRAAGATACIGKPVRLGQLAALIARPAAGGET
jgi:signal transduction histidine kinase/CheY-like chemotaxis protein